MNETIFYLRFTFILEIATQLRAISYCDFPHTHLLQTPLLKIISLTLILIQFHIKNLADPFDSHDCIFFLNPMKYCE